MLTDIFSSFDPSTNMIFNLSPVIFWLLLLMAFTMFFSSLWSIQSSLSMIMYTPMKFMSEQLTRGKSNILKGMSMLIAPLFLFMIILNLFGLIPYMFSLTSHLMLTLSFGLPLWLGLIMSSLSNSPKEFAANLLPSGAPSWLAPALVLIESISILVRPITLSFRLAANMSTGHIILGLVNMYAASSINPTSLSFITLTCLSLGYTMFEMGICLAQAYIFCLLISLYADEHSS